MQWGKLFVNIVRMVEESGVLARKGEAAPWRGTSSLGRRYGMSYALHQGDALAVLPTLPSASVHAVVADPPYGIDFQSAWRTATPKFRRIAGDKRPFIWWLPEAYRVLKDDSALLCFCRWDVAEDWRRAIGQAGFAVKSQVVWDRAVIGMGDLKGAYGPQHDIIWFATKGKFVWPGKRPASVIRVPRVPSNHVAHPNEKPVALLEQLIGHVTRPGDVVLDPFAGSGSTGVAALKTGRGFVGVELDEEHFNLAGARLANA